MPLLGLARVALVAAVVVGRSPQFTFLLSRLGVECSIYFVYLFEHLILLSNSISLHS